MTNPRKSTRLPAIIVGRPEHQRLTLLAVATIDRSPEVAEELLFELERAKVVAPERVPHSVVQMGSEVTYVSGGKARTVTLVYPGDADIAVGRVSIMTPIGAALLGLSEGQSIGWMTRGGGRHELTVRVVRQPHALKANTEQG